MTIGEKIRHIRKVNKLTQNDMATMLGISRVNLSSIERGSVRATALLTNCISLMFQVDKAYLLDDKKEVMDFPQASDALLRAIVEKYELLSDDFKKFIEQQINELLKIQEKGEGKESL